MTNNTMPAYLEPYMTLVKDCEKRKEKWKEFDETFIPSIKSQLEKGKNPSTKQIAALENIWERLTLHANWY